MADNQIISKPYLVINNEAVEYVGNSLAIKNGEGERFIHVVSSGGNNVKPLYTEDVTAKRGMVKFSVRLTNEMMEKIKTWQQNESANAISVFSGDYSASMKFATMITDPELPFGADVTADIEFEGLPIA